MLQCLTKNVVEFCATNGWKCPDVSLKTPSFPATNTAGNVVKSRQKYPVLMPQILLEMSRRSIKTIEWFHTYRDEMQPGTAERKVRSYRKVKMMWQKCMTRTNSNISVFRGNVNCQHFTPATEPTSATGAHHCPPTSRLSGVKSGEIIRKRLLRTTATLKTVIL